MVKRLEITKLSVTSIKQNPHRVDARPIYAHENAQVIILNLKNSTNFTINRTYKIRKLV